MDRNGHRRDAWDALVDFTWGRLVCRVKLLDHMHVVDSILDQLLEFRRQQRVVVFELLTEHHLVFAQVVF